jgi:hypothetical protein
LAEFEYGFAFEKVVFWIMERVGLNLADGHVRERIFPARTRRASLVVVEAVDVDGQQATSVNTARAIS